MEAIINGYYKIEVVKSTHNRDELSLRVSFSLVDYPDFFPFLANSIKEKKPVTYWENQQESRLLVIGCSFAVRGHMNDSVRNEDIVLREEVYGTAAASVPVEKRKEFFFQHAYGRIDVKKLSG